ncbi:hypothetical protein [Streptomyces sp. NPDC058268]|uniref:hypothetical protein n=1 Tax=Streptomyces sp. NPDC058268 TaxID=3346413 RepID=UPI0036ECE893
MAQTVTKVFVVNASTRVTDHDVDLATQAVAHQVRDHFAPLWGIKVPVVAFTKQPVPAPGTAIITVYDTPDVDGALGYHTEDKGVIYGKVFAGVILDNGGTALTGAVSVSACLSHEVLETLGDPRVQLWASNDHGAQVAYEVCDPVQGDTYDIVIHGTAVAVSDFVTPAWFDAQETGEQLNYLSTVTKPFALRKNGYVVRMVEGSVTNVFGESMPGWQKDLKRKHGRISRRAA